MTRLSPDQMPTPPQYRVLVALEEGMTHVCRCAAHAACARRGWTAPASWRRDPQGLHLRLTSAGRAALARYRARFVTPFARQGRVA